MEPHLAAIIPYATAVALSPMAIAALILMLFSKRAKANSLSFALGWIAGIYSLVFLVNNLILLYGFDSQRITGFPIELTIHFVLGIVLILFAVKEFRLRPKKGQEPIIPSWMSAVPTFDPLESFSIGYLLATVNFKNTPMGIAVGAVLADSGTNFLIVLISYVLLASSVIIITTIIFLAFGKKIEPTLATDRKSVV